MVLNHNNHNLLVSQLKLAHLQNPPQHTNRVAIALPRLVSIKQKLEYLLDW